MRRPGCPSALGLHPVPATAAPLYVTGAQVSHPWTQVGGTSASSSPLTWTWPHTEKSATCSSLGSSSRPSSRLSALHQSHDFSNPQFPHLYNGSIHSYLPFLTEIIVRLWWEGRKCRGQIRKAQPLGQQLKGTREGSMCGLCLVPALLVPFLKHTEIQNHYAVYQEPPQRCRSVIVQEQTH